MRVVRVLFLSLLLHLTMGLGLLQVPARWGAPRIDARVAEIEIVDKPSEPTDPRQMVRQTEVPEHLRDDESRDEARFLSEQRQRVVQETRSRRTGLTRNGQALPPDSWMRTMREPSAAAERTQGRRFEDFGGYQPIQLPRPDDPSASRPVFEDAPSATGETMPDDISIGNLTALNTDRFKYYSFYSRVEELVRFRWERGLERAIDAFDPRYLTRIVGRRNWTTSIEFWLTPEGRYLSAKIFKESGIRAFDLAAVGAFREAGIFPNPPREMISSDGVIKIQYTFNVHWSPAAMAGD